MCSCGTYSAAISLSCLKNFYCQANPQVKVTPGPKAEWLQIILLRPPRYCRAFEGFHGILWEKWVAHKAASSAWKGARVEFALSAATRSFDSGSEGKISLACLPSLTFRWSSLLPTHSGPQILRLLPSRVTQQHSSLSLASHDHTGQLRTGFPPGSQPIMDRNVNFDPVMQQWMQRADPEDQWMGLFDFAAADGQG